MLPYDDIYEVKDVRIGENCWIGADVSIMPGVNIGEGVVIAACACVTKNIPPYSVIGGVPAKIIKNRDAEKYKQLKNAGEIYLTKKRNGTTIIDENQRCVYVENNKKNIQ
ncbi:MAG: DapH/DapD/GlmU-related protein [Candidatus Merdousia sp.]|nr:DapH/DapD/GlmU-related protein [Candidatus Merdousia sp.]